MNQNTENRTLLTRSQQAWHVLGVVLFVVFVASCFAWGPFGFIFYVGGLFNRVEILAIVYLTSLLILAAAVCLPVVAVGTARRWRGLTGGQRLLRAGAVVVCVALVGSFCLGFVGVTPAPYDMYVRGFAGYAERRTDVAAIQDWLRALNPQDYREPYADRSGIPIPAADLPPAITRLGLNRYPYGATIAPDRAGRLMVRLMWGGGFLGHWGIEVGDVTMEPTIEEYCEYWRLAPGAYVWQELQ